jgi:hypothetical protein
MKQERRLTGIATISAIYFLNDSVEDMVGLQIFNVCWSTAGKYHQALHHPNSSTLIFLFCLFPYFLGHFLVFLSGLVILKVFCQQALSSSAGSPRFFLSTSDLYDITSLTTVNTTVFPTTKHLYQSPCLSQATELLPLATSSFSSASSRPCL